MTDPLIPIGEFSARSRLSVRMLRHYDERGVLVPQDVDPSTGYRRYASSQLRDAAAVRRLRDVGFTVSAIAGVLAARGTDTYERALRLRRDELGAELRTAHERLALIDQLLNEGQLMTSITVSTTTIPAMTVVAFRGVVPTYNDEGQLWERFLPELHAQGIAPIGPGGVLEHDREYRDGDVDESVWLPVAPGSTAVAPLVVHELPARDVVLARVDGPYTLISEAHSRIEAYLGEHGLTLAESGGSDDVASLGFNVYLTDPSTVAPEDNVTQVCLPLA